MLTIRRDDFLPFPFEKELCTAVKAHSPCILLVPEQLALSSERTAAQLLPAHAPLCFEVSNFSRLADRAFRLSGGISYRYADRASEALLMWKTLDAAAPFLSGGKTGASTDTVQEKLSAMNELWAAGLSPVDLRRAAAATEGEVLRGKLSDLSLIMELYEGEMREKYGSHAADLDKLLSLLKEKPLFADTEFFVSGFTSFTAKELLILGELARHAPVTVALPLPEGGERALCYEETVQTRRALLSLAAKANLPTREEVGQCAARPEALSYAKHALFRADRLIEPYGGDAGALSLFTAADPFAGCARIASIIAARVREGARFRDFTVLARESEKYDGILDAALAAQGIPYFFSVPTALPELSLSKMILSAYACINRGFGRSDVISYMKCGFSGIERDECDRFELYLSFWRLHGRALAEDKPFDMHPRGYEPTFTEADGAYLSLVNRVRVSLLSPLWKLKETAGATVTAREHAAALYRFLCDTNAERTLHEMARRERLAGRTGESETLLRLFPVICGLLDNVAEILGELPLSSARFAELLSLLFSSVTLGSLPTSQDAVTVGNADSLRPTDAKVVFLIGVNEGEFPASVGSSQGAFLEEERRALAALGVTVGKDPAVRASREQFAFLRALCCAEKEAFVLSFEENALGASVRPHEVFSRLCRLFPGAVRHFSAPPEIFTPRAALEQFAEHKNTAEGVALGAILAEIPAYARHASVAGRPIAEAECRIDADITARLFPDRLCTSQSRLEKYLDCPFSYFCRYVLRLPENERAAIRSFEIGTTMHAILEALFTRLDEEGQTIRTVGLERIAAYVSEACEAHLLRTCPQSMRGSPRISHVFTRLRRAATLVAKDLYREFAHSAFTPRFCELQLGKQDTPAALLLTDEDGKSVSIGGVIDRVDIYRAPSGETFVRVVDYKSSTHDFSREELRRGRNMQMFLYLCAIWKNENEAFRERLSLKPEDALIPAGVVYSRSSPALPTLAAPADPSAVEADVLNGLERSGFFLREEDVLRAMDDTFSGHLVPVTLDKSGSLKYGKETAFGSLEQFGEMLDETEDAVCAVARRMRRGVADATPDENAKYPPCDGCAFRAVCRRENE